MQAIAGRAIVEGEVPAFMSNCLVMLATTPDAKPLNLLRCSTCKRFKHRSSVAMQK